MKEPKLTLEEQKKKADAATMISALILDTAKTEGWDVTVLEATLMSTLEVFCNIYDIDFMKEVRSLYIIAMAAGLAGKED